MTTNNTKIKYKIKFNYEMVLFKLIINAITKTKA